MTVIAALWPVFGLLLLGWGSRRIGFPGEPFWPLAERLIYFVCFPALLVSRLADADFQGDEVLRIILAVVLLLVLATLLVVLLQRLLRFPVASFTSVFQGGLRFNTYIALAIAAALLPGSGMVYAALIAAVMIPLLNILCVVIFALYQERRSGALRVLLNLIQNPLILGCGLGAFLNLSGLGLPVLLADLLRLLAQIALPLGLLAVGAALNLRGLRSSGLPLLTAVVFRLALMPLLLIGVAWWLTLSQDAVQVLLVFAAVPTAPAAYILARQLGGDAPLMAAILSAQTLISLFSLPFVLAFGMQIYAALPGWG